MSTPATPVRRFAALRKADSRTYLIGAALAMMADNIEHVITYWVLWEKFGSPALAGFQVVSHWLPFLLFSLLSGALADRYDCRRVIQAGQLLFMLVSAAWGLLFLTGELEIWHACVLLVLHGCAGVLWGPAEQMMLHDFVGREALPSAVRLNATFKSLGVLCGPAVGSVLLLGLGPTGGIFANIAIYLPLTIFLFRTRFTGHVRDADRQRTSRPGFRDTFRVLREVRGDRLLVGMILLAGLGAFFVGASLQSTMPVFANDLGAGDAGTAYGTLLFAAGAGGVLGGLVLEATGWIRGSVPVAVAATVVYGLSTLAFAVTGDYLIAVGMLAISGVANLVATSTAQTVVQLRAPAAERGRVLGLYGMSSSGLRLGSGFTVGAAGAVVGVHTSLAVSAATMCVAALAVWAYSARGPAFSVAGPIGRVEDSGSDDS
ncbi:MFS transporter [Actinoplanes couchii]|uniref:MFS transporter n=1 Tax=Actinoplanes couchii TaxID=403638 RepID=A0ABQ3XDF2_9ACTN|nr:MFS transporter [Actinoplanes couchii]MDR6317048.1 MFS family permease [Actinoplanes couchii]GID56544.1 MFS transporter [Actinoplanes couchii]